MSKYFAHFYWVVCLFKNYIQFIVRVLYLAQIHILCQIHVDLMCYFVSSLVLSSLSFAVSFSSCSRDYNTHTYVATVYLELM